MRNRIVPLSLAAALALASVPVFANKGGQSGSHGNSTAAKSASVKPPTGSTHASAPKSSTPKNSHATTPTTTSAKGGSKKNGTSTTTSTNNTTTSSTTSTSNTSGTSTTATWTPSNPIAKKLSTKTTLLARATTKFGEQNLNLATSGFKNFGQFVAAMNVSNNLNIDFSKLKLAMTGTDLTGVTTGTGNTVSLGTAIQQLKPGVDANAEAAHAEQQAAAEIN